MNFIEVYVAFCAIVAMPYAIASAIEVFTPRWPWLDSFTIPLGLLAWLLGMAYVMTVS